RLCLAEQHHHPAPLREPADDTALPLSGSGQGPGPGAEHRAAERRCGRGAVTMHSTHPLRALVAVAGFAGAAQVAAADWQFNPDVEVGAMSDSNLRLSETGNDVSVAGAFATARLEMLALTPLASFSFTPRAEATWFPDDADRDEDYVNGGAGLLWTRRGRTVSSRFQADFDRSVSITGNRASVPGEDG